MSGSSLTKSLFTLLIMTFQHGLSRTTNNIIMVYYNIIISAIFLGKPFSPASLLSGRAEKAET